MVEDLQDMEEQTVRQWYYSLDACFRPEGDISSLVWLTVVTWARHIGAGASPTMVLDQPNSVSRKGTYPISQDGVPVKVL